MKDLTVRTGTDSGTRPVFMHELIDLANGGKKGSDGQTFLDAVQACENCMGKPTEFRQRLHMAAKADERARQLEIQEAKVKAMQLRGKMR